MAIPKAAVIVKEKSQILRKQLEKNGYWDSSRRLAPFRESEIAIPVLDAESLEQHRHGNSYNLCGLQFRLEDIQLQVSRRMRRKNPQDALHSALKRFCEENGIVWTDDLDNDIPNKWEVHDNMLLLPCGCFSRPEWQQLGDALWHKLCQVLDVKRLAMKAVITDDKYRTSQVRLIVGDTGWVEHVDNGIIYTYDVTRCMFSAGNITEKLRVASLDCTGETVVDLFAGIGYFTLPYLVHAAATRVLACEWNPNAVEALRQNLILNKVDHRCDILEGDNRETCPVGVADRVNLGLIPSSECSWHTACAALKPTGGVLHIHGNVTDHDRPITSQCDVANRGMLSQNCDDENSSIINFNQGPYSGTPGVHADDISSIPECGSPGIDKNITETTDTNMKNKFSKRSKSNPAWSLWARNVSRQIETILSDVQRTKWRTIILHIEHVKSYAPHVSHLVLDLDCRPTNK